MLLNCSYSGDVCATLSSLLLNRFPGHACQQYTRLLSPDTNPVTTQSAANYVAAAASVRKLTVRERGPLHGKDNIPGEGGSDLGRSVSVLSGENTAESGTFASGEVS